MPRPITALRMVNFKGRDDRHSNRSYHTKIADKVIKYIGIIIH